ncbi:MAG: LysR family transcriptional regulator [Roseovarius sp.]
MSETDPTVKQVPSLRLRIVFEGGAMIGPGKADLLDGIAETGSIAAAARAMNMSYKRAWMLVETMNAAFREPVVHSSRGGSTGGGAALTGTGAAVLAEYRKLQEITAQAGAGRIAALQAMLKDTGDSTDPPCPAPPNHETRSRT